MEHAEGLKPPGLYQKAEKSTWGLSACDSIHKVGDAFRYSRSIKQTGLNCNSRVFYWNQSSSAYLSCIHTWSAICFRYLGWFWFFVLEFGFGLWYMKWLSFLYQRFGFGFCNLRLLNRGHIKLGSYGIYTGNGMYSWWLRCRFFMCRLCVLISGMVLILCMEFESKVEFSVVWVR